jgi:adiponectin receptor
MQCIYSILKIHNETGNIWTHIVGFFFVLAMGLYWYPRSASYEMSTTADKFVCAVFFFAALECLACSTIWHTFSNFANLAAMKKIACIGIQNWGRWVDARLCGNFGVDCGDDNHG